ncbi:unnamed protein product, partial [Closterium sp. NIES-53]
MAHPKSQRSKPAADSDASVDVNILPDPASKHGDGKMMGSDEVNSTGSNNDNTNDAIANGYGLFAQEKASTSTIAGGSALTDADSFLEDDSDDDMVVDLDKEVVNMLRST